MAHRVGPTVECCSPSLSLRGTVECCLSIYLSKSASKCISLYVYVNKQQYCKNECYTGLILL